MAIYHLSIKIISRGKGKSAVAAVAYRAGEKIQNQFDGITHDYTKKSGIEHTEIMLPEHAPREFLDRSTLWNSVEKIEKASNSQLAREIEVALPVELTKGQNLQLVREYIKEQFVSKGMCADFAIHDKNDGNPHCHIMLTMRPLKLDRTWGEKEKKDYAYDEYGERIPLIDKSTGQQKVDKRNRKQWKREYVQTNDWNNLANAEIWRENWSVAVNALLEKENQVERIDHRSYKRQGVDKLPTIHLGVSASQMERKGIKTNRGNYNRNVMVTNSEIKQLKARIRKCNDWIYSQPIENAPTMMSVVTAVSKGENLNKQWEQVADLKTQAKILVFLQSNDIRSISQLADKIKNVNDDLYETADKIKKVDRRLDSLEFSIEQAEIRKKYKPIYDEYNKIQPSLKDKLLKRDPQEEYYNKHFKAISDYEEADRYLKEYLNGKVKTAPLKKWKSERDTLTAERIKLGEKFYNLKDETRSVEIIRKGVDILFTEQERQRQQQRTQSQKLQKKHENELS